MTEAYGAYLYFNYPAFKDTIILVVDNEKNPDEVKKNGDFVALYCHNKLIGINIFNSSSYLKIHLEGLLHNPNTPLDTLIHSLILAYLHEDVHLLSSPVILGKYLRKEKDDYIVQVASENEAKAGLKENTELRKDEFVLLSPKEARLDDGNLAAAYLSKNQDYLIIGVEEGDISDFFLGTETYALKEGK